MKSFRIFSAFFQLERGKAFHAASRVTAGSVQRAVEEVFVMNTC